MSEVANLVRLFKSLDTTAQRAFLQACPPSRMKEAALGALSPTHLDTTLMGLNLLADTYSRGSDCELGITISKTVFFLAKEAFEADRSVNHLINAGRGAINCLLGLQSLGRHAELIEFATDAERWLGERDHKEDIPTLMLYRLEAYINLGEFAEADALLALTDWQQTFQRDRPAEHDKLEGLKRRLEQARQHASTLSIRAISDRDQIIAQRRQMLDMVRKTLAVTAAPEDAELIRSQLDQFASEVEKDVPDSLSEWARRSQGSMNMLTDFISGGDSEMSQMQNQKRIRNAQAIFLDPQKAHDPKEIDKSIPMLLEAREWAKQHNFTEDQNDALWSLYLCYSRTGRDAQAIDALQELRSNLEETRSRISDPLERAGVMTKFPYLFGALCRLLCKSNRPAQLLDAMEGAKGRVIADVLTQKRGKAVSDKTFSKPSTQLPELMSQMNAHYLSYFVDDDATYAVLVARDGSLHNHSIELGMATLREYSKQVDPSGWGKSRGGLYGAKSVTDITDRLSPLVAWLEPLAELGLIRDGDHLCYCPDDELHLIPLHFVSFRGKPLVDYLSVSRIQGALALSLLLSDRLEPLKRFIAVQVPSKQDLDDAAKISVFKQVSDWLAQKLPGEVISDEAADLESIQQSEWTGRIVHFATHGTFPREGGTHSERDPNPYTASGLVLSTNEQLPDMNLVANGKADDTLLTPSRALELDFSGSHVTMQACVSGLAKEGIGGDALGLEWALLQAGASSLLATHWNVDATGSAAFSLRFYQKWLFDGCSRARAWRESVLELIAEESTFDRSSVDTQKVNRTRQPGAYYWAGFSLSGDWR